MSQSSRSRVRFQSGSFALSGILEQAGQSKTAALLAHPFSSTKDLRALSRISRNLSEQGIAVLRFDHRGLGDSEGSFENATYESHVDDMLAAYGYLAEQGMKATVFMGLSLGGIIALAAAAEVKACKLVTTINAPSSPTHVLGHFTPILDEIKRKGALEVEIVGRRRILTKKLIESFENASLEKVAKQTHFKTLIMHTRNDTMVAFNQAEQLMQSLNGEKSLVEIKGSDHLLSDEEGCAQVVSAVLANIG